MFCKYCGNEISDSARFCNICGKETSVIDNNKVTIEKTKNYISGNRKTILWFILIFLILGGIILAILLSGGKKEHDDNLILSEIQGFGSNILQDMTVTDVEVLRKQILEESKQETVYCAVAYRDEKKECKRNATLIYSYYDEGGWNLESVEFDKEVQTCPVAGPSADDISLALGNVENGEILSSEYVIKNSSVDLEGKRAEYEIELNAVCEKYHISSKYKLPFFFLSEETARSYDGWRAGGAEKLDENISLIDMDSWTDRDWFESSYWRGFVAHTLEVEDDGDHYNLSLLIEDNEETFFSGQVEIEKEGHTRDDDGNIVLEFPDVSEETNYPSLRITINADSTVVIKLCRSDGAWY